MNNKWSPVIIIHIRFDTGEKFRIPLSLIYHKRSHQLRISWNEFANQTVSKLYLTQIKILQCFWKFQRKCSILFNCLFTYKIFVCQIWNILHRHALYYLVKSFFIHVCFLIFPRLIWFLFLTSTIRFWSE